MHSKGDNIEIMISDEADEIIKKNFLIQLQIDISVVVDHIQILLIG